MGCSVSSYTETYSRQGNMTPTNRLTYQTSYPKSELPNDQTIEQSIEQLNDQLIELDIDTPIQSTTPSRFRYDITAELLSDGNHKVTKYKSQSSGITICIIEVPGPVVEGYFTFATETFDDDGLPHTLEHLVFLGSEKYPYKGVLDMIASRCLCEGTNAWTGVDHTCYTVDTAGDEGFLKILPIYLDHLLFPTLTDAAFTTEVHHINGEGEDAGVVYCEMQARENSSTCSRALVQAMYPGRCGNKSESGGRLKNLRESTTNEKVRAYHKQFYRPDNLLCLIIGQIQAEKVFEAIIPVEERLLQEAERTEFVRPWQTPIDPLPGSTTIEVECPSNEEEFGVAVIAWRGPLINDFITISAFSVLFRYLTRTAVSPFKRDFIETDDPLCNFIRGSVSGDSETYISLTFDGIPVSRLSELKDKTLALLKDVADGKEEIDMQRITTIIKKSKSGVLCIMESSPHSHLSSILVQDFIYGSSVEDLENRLGEIATLEKLLEKDAQFWIDLLKTYMIDRNHVIVLGTPSSKLAKEMAEKEKQRIAEQKEKLGEEGLQEKAEILKKAIEENEIPPPKEMLTSVTVPSVKSIKLPSIKRISNAADSYGDDIPYDVKKMPCLFQVDSLQTHFVWIYVMIDINDMPLDSRMYMPLLIELLTQCAIERNGEIVPYQDVVKQIAEDAMVLVTLFGLGGRRFSCSAYAQTLLLVLMVEEEKYEKSVQWIREILFHIHIEPSRIKSILNKIITNVPCVKDSGSLVCTTMMKNLCFRPESNHWSNTVFRQHAFLTKLQQQLESDPDEVISKLNEIRESIAKPEKMVVHLALNLESIRKNWEPEEVWIQELLPPNIPAGFMESNIKKCSEFLRPFEDNDTRGLIAGIGSEESSELHQTAACLLENKTDYACLLVACCYFTQSEGPMWRQIRGCGYAYSYSISVCYTTGLITFTLCRATHLVQAYKEAAKIIDLHLNGTTEWDLELLASARSSTLFDVIKSIKTPSDFIDESLKAYIRDCTKDVNKEFQEMIEKVSEVTTSDMERVGIQYLKPLFNPELSRCTVTCNPSKVEELAEEFKTISRELTVVPSLDDNFMYEY